MSRSETQSHLRTARDGSLPVRKAAWERPAFSGHFSVGLLIGGAVVMMAASGALALDPSTAIDQYPKQVWTVEQGLPQNSVETILQDRAGFMWFGTQEGLARFDGVSFEVLDRSLVPEFGENVVASLAEDAEGSLWVGTTRGLCRLIGEKATAFGKEDGLPGRGVRSILVLGSDEVWVGTRGGGVAVWRPSGIRTLARQDGLVHDGVWRLARDLSGAIWVATSGGVSRVRGEEMTSFGREHGLPGIEVRALRLRRDGSIWVGTEGGVARFDGSRFVGVVTREELGGAAVWDLLEDRHGSLWIATFGAGLFRLVGNRLDRCTEKQGFPGDIVRSLHEDREGSLWVGFSSRGVARLKDASFVTVLPRHGLAHDLVTSVLEDREGILWVGTFGGGLARLGDGEWSALTRTEGLPSNDVWSLAQDRAGAIWVGTLGSGVARLSAPGVKTYSTRSGLSSDGVRAILQDRSGAVWVATRNGLSRIVGDEITVLDSRQGLSSDGFYCLYQDQEARLWLGTSGGGVNRLDGGRAVTFPESGALSGETVYDIFEDEEGVFWFGTASAGIWRLRDEIWAVVTTREGLFDNTAYRLLADDQGHFWVSCNKGVFRVSRRGLAAVMDGLASRVECTVFGVGDGLASAEANGGSQPSGWKTRDGRMWFPTTHGLAVVDPARLVRNEVPPGVQILKLVADGERFAATAPVRLGPGRNDLEIHFAGLSFRSPAGVRFRYRLEGFEREWVDAGSRRVAFYTNLPPYSYRFQVLAANEDGVWSPEPAFLDVTITPPYWSTWWFRTLGFLAVLGIAFSAYRLRVRHLENERQVLETTVAERTAELAASRDQLATRSAQLEEIDEIVKAINSPQQPGDVLGLVLSQLRFVRGVARASALSWDRESEVFRYRAAWGWSPGLLDEIEMSADEAQERFERQGNELAPELLLIGNHDGRTVDDRLPVDVESGAFLVMRIRVEDRVEGYLVLESTSSEDAFEEQDLLVLESLHEHIRSAFIKWRMLAELQTLNEKKNELLGMAAHDLRSPLGIISGWTAIVMQSLESGRFTAERAVRELARVVSVAEHLARLVTELLDVSAIESGNLRVALAPTSVPEVITDCMQLYSKPASDKSMTLSFEPPRGKALASADRDRLTEVISNLLSNAIKFTPRGGRINLRCVTRAGEVETHVEDTGPGLTEEDLRLVFTRFGRLSARPTAGESSTGLGLAIVKKIVKAHGGRVWATSRSGGGACFSFALPAAATRTRQAGKKTKDADRRPSG